MIFSTAELSRFNLTPEEARRLQAEIPPLVIRQDRLGRVRTVAGADFALLLFASFDFAQGKPEASGPLPIPHSLLL